MLNDRIRQLAVVAIVAITIFVNVLANALPLNGQNTGEISDRFPILFVPAGYVFSIWGIIYLGLIAFAVYQALPSQRENPRLRSTGWWFVLGNAANTVWIFLWHYNQFPATLVAMITLLISLIVIYLRLGKNRIPVSEAERWAVRVPISVYLGWITVATIANVTQVLYYLGWNGAPITPELWAVIMLIVALVVAAAMLIIRRDIAYALVVVWAAVGIAVAQSDAPLVPETAWFTAAAVAVLITLTFFKVLPGKLLPARA